MENKSLTKKTLILLLVSIINLNLYPQSPLKGLLDTKVNQSKMADRRAQRERKQDTEFMMKYGVTYGQLHQIKEIRILVKSQIKQLLNSELSKTEKVTKIKMIRDAAKKKREKILTPAQWKQLTYDRETKSEKVRAIVKNHKKSLKTALKQPNSNKTQVQSELEKLCKQQLSIYVNLKQANIIVNKIKLKRISRHKEFKIIPLNNSDKNALARFKLQRQQQISKLNRIKFSKEEIRKRKKDIDQTYYAKVKDHIGNVRFTQWRKFQDTALERRCKNKYHFTKQQWKLFADIKNSTAAAKLKIRQSRLSKEHKIIKVKYILAQERSKVKNILTPEQYTKWSQSLAKKQF